MSYFLFKPHVAGPENNVTSPDVMIDRVSIVAHDNEVHVPVQRLSSHFELQAIAGLHSITMAYALVACGGGIIVAPAAVVCPEGQLLTVGDVVVARSAWRLRNVLGHFAEIALSSSAGERAGECLLSVLLSPAQVSGQNDGDEPALSRGVMKLCVANTDSLKVEAPNTIGVQLKDDNLSRQLNLNFRLDPVDADQWGDKRPFPRYTVGPVGDVKHYI